MIQCTFLSLSVHFFSYGFSCVCVSYSLFSGYTCWANETIIARNQVNEVWTIHGAVVFIISLSHTPHSFMMQNYSIKIACTICLFVWIYYLFCFTWSSGHWLFGRRHKICVFFFWSFFFFCFVFFLFSCFGRAHLQQIYSYIYLSFFLVFFCYIMYNVIMLYIE